MKRWLLGHSASLSWTLLSEVVIVLAVLLSLSRLVLPFANEFSDVIAEQMEEMIHYPVSIGKIDASWAGVKPLIKLGNVVVGDLEHGEALARFDRIRLKINPWESLSQGKLVPESLTLRGSQIEIERTKNGQLQFRGFEFTNTQSSTLKAGSLEKLVGLKLNLRDIHLIWNDRVLDQQFEFDAEKLDIQITENSLVIDSKINLPQSLGENVHLIAKTTGPIDDLGEWQTEVYLKGESIDIQGIPFALPEPLPELSAGEVSLELWGNWTQSTGLVMTGDFEAHSLRFDGNEQSGRAGRYEFVDQVAANLKLHGKLNDWQLHLDQLDIVTSRRHWPDNGLSIAYQNLVDEWDVEATQQSIWSGHIDFIDSGELLRLAALSPRFQGRWSEQLLETDPQGELLDFDFKTTSREGLLTQYRLAAVVEDFAWQATHSIPGASAVSGSISFDQLGGDAVIANAKVDYFNHNVFDDEINLDQFQADIAWQQSEARFSVSLDRLKLANADFYSTGTVLFERSKGQAPHLDLEMIVPQIEATSVVRLIPYPKVKSKKARKWLRHAFLDGQAHNGIFSYHGELSASSLRSNKTRLRAEFDVKDAQIHYRNDWPDAKNLSGRVRFENTGLEAKIHRGKILNASLGPVEVAIENLLLSRLQINGSAQGDVSELLGFLRQSPLVRDMDALLDGIRSQGESQLELALDIPISRKIVPREAPKIQGYLAMEDGHLTLPGNDLSFQQVSGVLAFENRKYTATGLTANFRGGKITTNIGTDKDANILVESRGELPASALLPALKKPLEMVASGSSLWRSQLTIPSRQSRADGERLSLKLTSDLKGTTLSLPDEFAKQAGDSRKLSLNFQMGKNPNLKLWLGQRVFFDADFKTVVSNGRTSSKKLQLRRGILELSGGAGGTKPESGFALAGKWPVLKLQPWLQLTRKLSQPKSGSGFNLTQVNLDVERFFVSDSLAVTNSKLIGEKQLDRWRFNVAADELAGSIDLPTEWSSDEQINAKLRYLKWPKPESPKAATGRLSAIGFPAINAAIETTQIGDRALGAVTLKTIPTTTGVKISHLTLSNDSYQAVLSGGWNEFNHLSQSVVDIQITTRDTGKTLEALGFNSDLSNGIGNLTGHISWPDTLFSPDLNTANGHFDLNIQQGKLDNVEPGLGRLISLVSLNNLPRRFALNFKDLSEEGLYFDTLSGGLNLKNGELVMADMRIDSPLVDVDIAGSTNLQSRHHDLVLEVTPKIKSSLPIAASLLAGPQTGALVFLLDKLAESMGLDLNKTVVRNFAVSGSWENPSVDSLQTFARDSSESSIDQLLLDAN